MNDFFNNIGSGISLGRALNPNKQSQTDYIHGFDPAPVSSDYIHGFDLARTNTAPSSTLDQYGQVVGDNSPSAVSARYSAMNPQNLNVPVGNSYDSSILNSGASPTSLNNLQGSMYQDMTTGKNTDLIPSDSLLQQIYNTKQYSPEEQQGLQNLSDINTQITATQLAARRQIKDLQENGMITKEQASAFLSEAQRRSDAQLADLAVGQTAATNNLGVLAAIRNNQLGAYQTLFDMTKGSTTLSPGQGLYNAMGTQVAGAAGIAPQVTSLASQLYSQALASGTAITNPQTGQPDMSAYLQQASQLTGLPLPQGTISSPSYGGAQMNQGGGDNFATTGNETNQAYQYALSKGLQPAIAGAVVQSPITGDTYISGQRLPSGLAAQTNTQSGRTGIAYVPPENVPNIQQLDIALGQMKNIWELAQKKLTPGFLGRLQGLTTNKINAFLQTDPDWKQFTSLRLQAIDYLKGLAQGGGFRTTESEINTAANSIADISDNLESAKSSMDMAMKNINLAYKEYLPTHNNITLEQLSGNTPTQSSIGSSGSNVIQTKIGAVDNSWFK